MTDVTDYHDFNAWLSASPSMRKQLMRGKHLGDHVTDEQYAAIKDGSFTGLFLGDYWIINNIYWHIVDFDYWFTFGDSECLTHHLVIMPSRIMAGLFNMNDTKTTSGGYANSKMRTTYLPTIKQNIIDPAFGSEHILLHRNSLVNGVIDSPLRVSIAWYDSTVEIPTEAMIIGQSANRIAQNGLDGLAHRDVDIMQLAYMRLGVDARVPYREAYWLRDICGTMDFTICGHSGYTQPWLADSKVNIRPVFGLIG